MFANVDAPPDAEARAGSVAVRLSSIHSVLKAGLQPSCRERVPEAAMRPTAILELLICLC